MPAPDRPRNERGHIAEALMPMAKLLKWGRPGLRSGCVLASPVAWSSLIAIKREVNTALMARRLAGPCSARSESIRDRLADCHAGNLTGKFPFSCSNRDRSGSNLIAVIRSTRAEGVPWAPAELPWLRCCKPDAPVGAHTGATPAVVDRCSSWIAARRFWATTVRQKVLRWQYVAAGKSDPRTKGEGIGPADDNVHDICASVSHGQDACEAWWLTQRDVDPRCRLRRFSIRRTIWLLEMSLESHLVGDPVEVTRHCSVGNGQQSSQRKGSVRNAGQLSKSRQALRSARTRALR